MSNGLAFLDGISQTLGGFIRTCLAKTLREILDSRTAQKQRRLRPLISSGGKNSPINTPASPPTLSRGLKKKSQKENLACLCLRRY